MGKTMSDFLIGDAVRHVSTKDIGVVAMHDHGRGLVKIRWESGATEWVHPSELDQMSTPKGA